MKTVILTFAEDYYDVVGDRITKRHTVYMENPENDFINRIFKNGLKKGEYIEKLWVIEL